MRATVIAVLALVLVGCSGTRVTPDQANFICSYYQEAVNVGQGMINPFSFTHRQVMEEYHLEPPEASELVRQALSDYCPTG